MKRQVELYGIELLEALRNVSVIVLDELIAGQFNPVMLVTDARNWLTASRFEFIRNYSDSISISLETRMLKAVRSARASLRLVYIVFGLINTHTHTHTYTYAQKAHPLGTAVLSSSSNESTVGRETDMLLGERSMGLVASPFIPVVDTRLSIIIKAFVRQMAPVRDHPRPFPNDWMIRKK